MVKIEKINEEVIFEVEGWHKLWAFRRRIKVRLESIHNAEARKPSIHEIIGSSKLGSEGMVVLGTKVLGVIKAGTFYEEGKWIFWDVSNKEKVVIIDLINERYNKMIIEVNDPAEVVKLISRWKLEILKRHKICNWR